MLSEKIKKRYLLISVLTTVFVGFILIFSNQDTIMNFAFREQSGEKDRSFTLKGKAFNIIEWRFVSTSTVSLLIIKEVTLNYINDLASRYGEWIRDQMLEDSYVSQDKKEDSGTFYVSTQETILLIFSTTGSIKYQVKYDPFSIDLLWIFCGLLGLFSLIRIISSITQLIKINKIKILNDKNVLGQSHYIKYNCEHCGVNIDSDSIFCHECGCRLNKYK